MVDRFRISVSRKPCIVERKGGYFRTGDSRQTCLRGIFNVKDPWWQNFFSLTHHFLFRFILETVRRRAKRRLFSDSRHQTNMSIGYLWPRRPLVANFFFADSSLPVTFYLGNRVSQSKTEVIFGLETLDKHVYRVSLAQKTPDGNFFPLTHHYLLRFILETVQTEVYFRTWDTR